MSTSSIRPPPPRPTDCFTLAFMPCLPVGSVEERHRQDLQAGEESDWGISSWPPAHHFIPVPYLLSPEGGSGSLLTSSWPSASLVILLTISADL